MKLFYDSEKTEELLNKMVEYIEEGQGERNEVHLSDSCYCPIKVYNRLTGMVPLPITKKDAGFFIVGTVGQRILQELYPPEQRETESKEIVSAHTDVLEDMKYPLEAKWTSQKIFRAGDVPLKWNKQLMGYESIWDADKGWFVFFNLFSRQLMAFKMVMRPEEREEYRNHLKYFKWSVLTAVDTEDPTILKCFMEEDIETQKKECRTCRYRPTTTRKRLELPEGCTMYVKSTKKKTK